MNKAKYQAMPADLRAIIDKNSGEVAARMAGKVWDDQAVTVSDMVRKRGNSITTLSMEENMRWRKACEPVREAWLKSMKDKGLDGGKLLAAAEAMIAEAARA